MRKEQAKELVRMIFGDEIANDSDIVDFYLQVNKDATQEYADEQTLGFADWIVDNPSIGCVEKWTRCEITTTELLTIYKQENGII